MATVQVSDSESFGFAESSSNGLDDNYFSSESFQFVEEASVINLSTPFVYRPPFDALEEPLFFIVGFDGVAGYDAPSNTLHINTSSDYPIVAVQFFDATQEFGWPRGTTPTSITFDVSRGGGGLTISRTVTIISAAGATGNFFWPGTGIEPGEYWGRFALNYSGGGRQQVPTFPVRVIVSEFV